MMKVLYLHHEINELGGCTHSLANMLNAVKGVVEPVIIFRAKGLAYQHFVDLGYACYVVPFKLNILPSNYNYFKYIPRKIYDYIYNRRALLKLKNICRTHKIEIIHTNTSVITIGCDLSKLLNLKHVWHFREFQDLDFGMHPFCGEMRFRQYIEDSDVVIAISDAIYKHHRLESHHNSYVLWNAVRSKQDVCLNPYKEKYFVFCAALLSKAKGIDAAIRIFAMSKLGINGYKLKIIGKHKNEHERKELYKQIKELEIFPNVEFLGYRKDVKPIIANATAFLMCSKNEALGRVTIEAMFYGCPILGRNSGGTKEIVEEGYDGLLFSTEEEAALLLRRLAEEPLLQKNLAYNAQIKAINEFSEEGYGQKLIGIYKKIL